MLFDRILHALRRLISQARSLLHGWNDEPVERGQRHKRIRFYFYNPAADRGRRQLVFYSALVLVAVFAFSSIRLISYAMDYAEARRASNAMRKAYYETEETLDVTDAAQTAIPTPEPTPAPTAVAEQTAQPDATGGPTPTVTPMQRLPEVPYPNNPYKIVSTRFQKLRRQNGDIVGWLKIDGMIDEAVVQRDNEYYLDRDYLGYHNVNGAIFLDENCDLRTRPYTLMLFGHNMKSGLMFGSLRNYENPTYYHNNPFITFDSAYEDGRYVVFSVATISLDASDWRYVNLAWLISSSVSLRNKAISSLTRFSVYNNTIDVRPEDQLLLLVTCVDDPNDRRIVTARRLRDGETEEALLRQVKTIRLK